MANTVRIKRRVSGNVGAPTGLKNAELAMNEVDGVLYYGKGDDGAGNATSVIAVAGTGGFVDLGSSQTISGAKTFSSTIGGSVSGNAATADSAVKLSTSRTISISGDGSASGSFDGTANLALSLTLGSVVTAGTYYKVTVDAKGRVTSGQGSLLAADIPTLTASKISDFDTQVRTSRLDQMAAPTASVAMNSQRITGVSDPSAAQDAATKAYVDSVAQGLNPKQSVKAATTTNLAALSGAMTVDGISLVAGDRVLVKDQTTASANGLYVVASGSWTRATDADAWAELVSAYVFVEQGSTNADNGFLCTVDTGTLGTTSVTFVQFSGAGQITAGAGLTKTGNQLDIATASSARIVINADSIDLATAGTAGTYKSVTTDAYGRVTAGSNPTTLSGYGITDALSTSAVIDGGTF